MKAYLSSGLASAKNFAKSIYNKNLNAYIHAKYLFKVYCLTYKYYIHFANIQTKHAPRRKTEKIGVIKLSH